MVPQPFAIRAVGSGSGRSPDPALRSNSLRQLKRVECGAQVRDSDALLALDEYAIEDAPELGRASERNALAVTHRVDHVAGARGRLGERMFALEQPRRQQP